jgi:hypothetical protein
MALREKESEANKKLHILVGIIHSLILVSPHLSTFLTFKIMIAKDINLSLPGVYGTIELLNFLPLYVTIFISIGVSSMVEMFVLFNRLS